MPPRPEPRAPRALNGWGYHISLLGRVPRIVPFENKVPRWMKLPAFACRITISIPKKLPYSHTIQVLPNETEQRLISRALMFARHKVQR